MILGGTVGGGLAAIILAGGAVLLWHKKRRLQTPYKPEVYVISAPISEERGANFDTLFEDRIVHMQLNNVHPTRETAVYVNTPEVNYQEQNSYEFTSPRVTTTETASVCPTTRTWSSKTVTPIMSRNPRFILHTDAEDLEEREEEVVELPPQYNPSRARLPTSEGQSIQPSTSGMEMHRNHISESGPSSPRTALY